MCCCWFVRVVVWLVFIVVEVFVCRVFLLSALCLQVFACVLVVVG